jgi:Collagen triple helix repeat (20 copies)
MKTNKILLTMALATALIISSCKGPEGDTGPVGPQGAKGDTGTAGVAGKDGAQGIAGKDGVSGKDGLGNIYYESTAGISYFKNENGTTSTFDITGNLPKDAVKLDDMIICFIKTSNEFPYNNFYWAQINDTNTALFCNTVNKDGVITEKEAVYNMLPMRIQLKQDNLLFKLPQDALFNTYYKEITKNLNAVFPFRLVVIKANKGGRINTDLYNYDYFKKQFKWKD